MDRVGQPRRRPDREVTRGKPCFPREPASSSQLIASRCFEAHRPDLAFFIFGGSFALAALCWLGIDVTRPLVVDKKLHYSNRAGGGSYVEYVYSDTETTSRIRLYRWSDALNDWDEIDASAFGEAPSR